MQFDKRLRDGVRRGQITCSVRIWMRPHVKVGGRYAMEEGDIEVDAILPIELADITPGPPSAPLIGFENCDKPKGAESRWRTTCTGDRLQRR